MHFPHNYNPFGDTDEDTDELGTDSSSEELWEEVCRLRDDLATAEKALETVVRRLDMTAEAKALDGKPVLVIKFKEYNDNIHEDLRELAKVWSKVSPQGQIVCIPDNISLESLSDEELSRVGLKRSVSDLSERDLYEEMLLGKRR